MQYPTRLWGWKWHLGVRRRFSNSVSILTKYFFPQTRRDWEVNLYCTSLVFCLASPCRCSISSSGLHFHFNMSKLHKLVSSPTRTIQGEIPSSQKFDYFRTSQIDALKGKNVKKWRAEPNEQKNASDHIQWKQNQVKDLWHKFVHFLQVYNQEMYSFFAHRFHFPGTTDIWPNKQTNMASVLPQGSALPLATQSLPENTALLLADRFSPSFSLVHYHLICTAWPRARGWNITSILN